MNPQMQGFASSDEILKNRIHVSNGIYINYDDGYTGENEEDSSYKNNGIEEDWMFGKIKLYR